MQKGYQCALINLILCSACNRHMKDLSVTDANKKIANSTFVIQHPVHDVYAWIRDNVSHVRVLESKKLQLVAAHPGATPHLLEWIAMHPQFFPYLFCSCFIAFFFFLLQRAHTIRDFRRKSRDKIFI